jgi:hypothetical protein
MVKTVKVYLDENNEVVPEEKAICIVETEFDDSGNIIKEIWRSLKIEKKK